MKRFLKIFAFCILAIVVIYALLPRYAQKALIYLTADIDDYKIFENRTVKAGAPAPWPKHALYGKVSVEPNWKDSLAQYETVAFAVFKDSALVLEDYNMGYSSNSWSNSFSAAKSIVGFAILSAVDNGFIESLDQPVADFIEEYRTEANKNLKIRDVLTMSSGLNWKESYKGLFNTTTESYYGNDINSLITGLEVEEEPGTVMRYKSGDTQVLALLLRKATGMTVSDYVSTYFWTPMGAVNDALWSLDREDGYEKAYCCFNTNVLDFARFGQLINNGGRWGNKQLISEALLREALSPATHLTDDKNRTVDYYGYQIWMLNYRGMDVKYMRGILGQYVIAIPEKNTIISRMGHKRSEKRYVVHPVEVLMYIDFALEILGEE